MAQEKQKGFTLVEIAIVLVIIGLLIGGVLKGQELIAGSKVKAMKGEVDGITTAYYAYFDRFSALPGDDNKASLHVGVTATTEEGDGNGRNQQSPWSTTNTQESRMVWLHLRAAGLISGSGFEQPKSPYGTMIGISENQNGLTGNVICIQNVPADAGKEYDIKYDDGVYNTGSIRGNNDYTAARNICSKL